MMLRFENLLALGKFLRFLLHNTGDVTRGQGAQFPGVESLLGAKKSQVINNFFQNSTFASKDLRFELGGVKLVSCTMHITIVCLAKMAKFVN